MQYLMLLTIIVISILFISKLLSLNYQRESFTKMIDSGRAEYHKQKRIFRRTASKTTEGLRSRVNRILRQAGF